MKPEDVEQERTMFGEMAGVGASYAMLAQEQVGQFPAAANDSPRQCFRLSRKEWEPALIPPWPDGLSEEQRAHEERNASAIVVFNLRKAIEWLEAEIRRVQSEGLL